MSPAKVKKDKSGNSGNQPNVSIQSKTPERVRDEEDVDDLSSVNIRFAYRCLYCRIPFRDAFPSIRERQERRILIPVVVSSRFLSEKVDEIRASVLPM